MRRAPKKQLLDIVHMKRQKYYYLHSLLEKIRDSDLLVAFIIVCMSYSNAYI